MIDAIYVEYYVIISRYSKLSLGTVFDPTSGTLYYNLPCARTDRYTDVHYLVKQ